MYLPNQVVFGKQIAGREKESLPKTNVRLYVMVSLPLCCGIVVAFVPSSYLAGVVSPAFLMSASPLRLEDIRRGKQQLTQELEISNIVKHLGCE